MVWPPREKDNHHIACVCLSTRGCGKIYHLPKSFTFINSIYSCCCCCFMEIHTNDVSQTISFDTNKKKRVEKRTNDGKFHVANISVVMAHPTCDCIRLKILRLIIQEYSFRYH